MNEDIKKVEDYLLSKPLLVFREHDNHSMFQNNLNYKKFEDILNYTTHIFPSTQQADGSEYCKRGANRSLGDLFRLIRSYYNVSLEDVVNKLHDMCAKKLITSFICPDIHKRVYSAPWHQHSLYWGKPNTNEFNMDFSNMNMYSNDNTSTAYSNRPISDIHFEL